MPGKREDLHVQPEPDHLDITVEELDSLWGNYMSAYETDRRPGEYTQAEISDKWNVPRGTVYERLVRLVKIGAVEKRSGRLNGRKTQFYRVISG